MDPRIFGLITAAIALFSIFELLRRQTVKEKYLVLWLLTAAAIATLAVYPGLLNGLAMATGIKSGPNVVLVIGGLAVTLVCVHLSVEVSRLEDRTRALAEEIGLLRLELDKRQLPRQD
ncbi:MAG: DUF2304 domain-containing protein [Marmoricola sp.]